MEWIFWTVFTFIPFAAFFSGTVCLGIAVWGRFFRKIWSRGLLAGAGACAAVIAVYYGFFLFAGLTGAGPMAN